MFLFLKYSQSVFAKYLAARVSQFRPGIGIFLVSWHEAGPGPSLVISGVPCPDPELRKMQRERESGAEEDLSVIGLDTRDIRHETRCSKHNPVSKLVTCFGKMCQCSINKEYHYYVHYESIQAFLVAISFIARPRLCK